VSPQAEQRAAEATAEALREMIGEHCDLCGKRLAPNEITLAAHDATGLGLCVACIESLLQ
jgi:hypothetical protein